MSDQLHFIVARSRLGWCVSLEADRITDHVRKEDARAAAEVLAAQAREDGEAAELVDLSDGR